ncbi:DUF4328 domain-containing protein [Yinghuangia soli]|uniref:DUF4328 domain-containing protein n=1 Tax=Yinghuangia soli TaxID=2908204 RepID=A0AA41Q1A2_9ACTN|nr:DUF4328 domain-containing protein [Yinghuangia soli]MCF2529466.1 DUF4328 domain-containing protein [Yinghuangia soli]
MAIRTAAEGPADRGAATDVAADVPADVMTEAVAEVAAEAGAEVVWARRSRPVLTAVLVVLLSTAALNHLYGVVASARAEQFDRPAVWVLLLVLIGPVFAAWFGSAHSNSRTYGVGQPRYSRPGAILCWLVPLGQMVMPYRATHEVVRLTFGTLPRRMVVLLRSWWTAWLAMWALFWASLWVIDKADAEARGIDGSVRLADTAFHLAGAAAAAAAVWLVVAVTREQLRRRDTPLQPVPADADAAGPWGCLIAGTLAPLSLVVLFAVVMVSPPRFDPPALMLDAEDVVGTWRGDGAVVEFSADGRFRITGMPKDRLPDPEGLGRDRWSASGRWTICGGPRGTSDHSPGVGLVYDIPEPNASARWTCREMLHSFGAPGAPQLRDGVWDDMEEGVIYRRFLEKTR